MPGPLNFDAFLGWVNVTDPNNIPPDARVLSADDLLRYEKLGQDTVVAVNALASEVESFDADATVAASIAQPESATRTTVQGLVDEGVAGFQAVIDAVPGQVNLTLNNEVPTRVTAALAADDTVANAAAAAVDTELQEAGVVKGLVEDTYAENNDTQFKGGFIGDNGRPTDLSFGADGKIPEPVMADWGVRLTDMLDLPVTVEAGLSTQAVGGFVGENNRETDLVFDAAGKVLDPVISDWAQRMGPVIGPYIPAIGIPVPKLDPIIKASGSRKIWVRDRDGVVKRQTSDPEKYAAWGDSLTDGWTKPPFAADQSDAWPGVLATKLGKPVYNGGKSGQSADEIALRQGGMILMIDPVTIPASGAVTVTTPSTIGWRLDRGWSDAGTIAGVPGTLSRSGSTLTFTRTAAGEAVTVSAPVPFESTLAAEHRNSVSMFMLGRNDIGYAVAGSSVMERIVMANVAAVKSLAPQNPRFLIFGTLNATGEGSGNSSYNAVMDSNRILSELYPDNYYDMRKYIVSQSIYDQGITPTAADLTAMQGDKPPASIMLDSIHYTVGTAATIAQKAYEQITLRGWNA